MAAHNLSPSLPAMMALLSLCVCVFFLAKHYNQKREWSSSIWAGNWVPIAVAYICRPLSNITIAV